MRTPNLFPGLLAVFLVAASVSACRTPEPESPGPAISGTGEPRAPDLGQGAPRYKVEGAFNMYVADPLRKVCAGAVPFFEFDSSDTRTTDQPSMKTLADCMKTGPMVGRSVKLIGHTDPRGTPGYNEKLGRERAERVKAYLVGQGIDASRVLVDSVGEDAASASPQDWPKDRRVEIQLVR